MGLGSQDYSPSEAGTISKRGNYELRAGAQTQRRQSLQRFVREDREEVLEGGASNCRAALPNIPSGQRLPRQEIGRCVDG